MSGHDEVVKYIQEIFQARLQAGTADVPIIIGISGPQGSGKSFGSQMALSHLKHLDSRYLAYPLLLDDVYLTHDKQVQLSTIAKHQLDDNKLLQGRGLPGTHDLDLLKKVFNNVNEKALVSMPLYDKSLFLGEGDRLDPTNWPKMNDGSNFVSILLVEGWFVGYKPLSEQTLKSRYETAGPGSALKQYKLKDLLEVNRRLADYEEIWQCFDYFINIESDDINNVYEWRIQQEHDLIKKKGTGMTDDQVRNFISRYMAMYELYYKDLCKQGVAKEGCNLNIEIDKNRTVRGVRRF